MSSVNDTSDSSIDERTSGATTNYSSDRYTDSYSSSSPEENNPPIADCPEYLSQAMIFTPDFLASEVRRPEDMYTGETDTNNRRPGAAPVKKSSTSREYRPFNATQNTAPYSEERDRPENIYTGELRTDNRRAEEASINKPTTSRGYSPHYSGKDVIVKADDLPSKEAQFEKINASQVKVSRLHEPALTNKPSTSREYYPHFSTLSFVKSSNTSSAEARTGNMNTGQVKATRRYEEASTNKPSTSRENLPPNEKQDVVSPPIHQSSANVQSRKTNAFEIKIMRVLKEVGIKKLTASREYSPHFSTQNIVPPSNTSRAEAGNSNMNTGQVKATRRYEEASTNKPSTSGECLPPNEKQGVFMPPIHQSSAEGESRNKNACEMDVTRLFEEASINKPSTTLESCPNYLKQSVLGTPTSLSSADVQSETMNAGETQVDREPQNEPPSNTSRSKLVRLDVLYAGLLGKLDVRIVSEYASTCRRYSYIMTEYYYNMPLIRNAVLEMDQFTKSDIFDPLNLAPTDSDSKSLRTLRDEIDLLCVGIMLCGSLHFKYSECVKTKKAIVEHFPDGIDIPLPVEKANVAREMLTSLESQLSEMFAMVIDKKVKVRDFHVVKCMLSPNFSGI